MSSNPISSDAHCDGLSSDPSYELTCLGSDSISGSVLKQTPKRTKGESTGRQPKTSRPETGNHANSDRDFWSAMTRFLVCSQTSILKKLPCAASSGSIMSTLLMYLWSCTWYYRGVLKSPETSPRNPPEGPSCRCRRRSVIAVPVPRE